MLFDPFIPEKPTRVEQVAALKKREHGIVIKGAEEEEEGQTKKRRTFNEDGLSNKKDAEEKERIHVYEKNQIPEKEPEKDNITEKDPENIQTLKKDSETSVEEGPSEKSQSTEIYIEQEQSEQKQRPPDVIESNKSPKPDPVTRTNAPKKTPEFKKVYHVRHQLQRLVYNKKEGEIPKDKYPEILAVLQQIEEAPMSYDLLKDTKVGKVVRAASVYPFEDNVIKERCVKLLRYWKTKYIDTLK
ncbi:hypothetical protein G6F56_011196 [Rhizopus delemar]|nr:hypothetical protein G6F56_011196 [Rhizopus delemar]